MIHIYKLKYSNKQEAIEDLINRSVYVETDEGLQYGTGIHAIVDLGIITLQYPIFGENGEELTEPIFAEGYHYDIMSEIEIDFGIYEIQVNNPRHSFAGY